MGNGLDMWEMASICGKRLGHVGSDLNIWEKAYI